MEDRTRNVIKWNAISELQPAVVVAIVVDRIVLLEWREVAVDRQPCQTVDFSLCDLLCGSPVNDSPHIHSWRSDVVIGNKTLL